MNSSASDEQKFLELVSENRSRILRVCRVYAWNSADQDDLYQEILCQIWRGLPGLKEQRFTNTWLYRVAINTALSFVRKRAARAERIVSFEHGELTRAIESRQGPEESENTRTAGLYSAIYKLDSLERALVTLFLEDFTYAQMAEVTGINASHVGVMLHRTKKKLFNLMKEEAPQ